MALTQKDAVFAGDLLGFAKTGVRNGAIAITETATPAVRDILEKHLRDWIDLHAQTFAYMHSRGLYPAYNPRQLIENDLRMAQRALQTPIKR